MPAWERNLLIDFGKRVLGVNEGGGSAEPQGDFSANEMAILTTPGVG